MERILPAWLFWVLSILLTVFLVLLILNQWKTLQGTSQIMSVSGTGHVTAIPDVATINIGVVSKGTQPNDVKNENNKKMNQVIDFVKAQGVDPKNITTTTLNLYPLFNYDNSQKNITGYQAEQTITVKIEGINKEMLQKIADGVVNQGANQIQGINFSFKDIDQWKSLARKNAIENAESKAKQLASDAHLRLGRIINVSESKNEGLTSTVYGAANANFLSKSVAPTIEPGSQNIDEMLTLLYEVH